MAHPEWAPPPHMGYPSKGNGIDKLRDATVEVPNEVLLKLVCENCDGYLSRGPVHLMDNGRYRCGRCLPSQGEQSTRVEAYEELAKLMTFPCSYQHNGCLSKVPFAENEAHEEACAYRKFICPIADSGQCEWTGIQTELLGHCQRDHRDNVVENPRTFTHNITQSSLHNYLLRTLGVLFLIQTKVCTTTRNIYHSVRLISDGARASNYKYTLRVQNKDCNFAKHRVVASRGCLLLQPESSVEIGFDLLQTMMEDFTGTTFTVTVESAGNKTVTKSSKAECSTAITRNTMPVKIIETTVECSECQIRTEPLYREGWLCWCHAPEREPCVNRDRGCPYSDFNSKAWKHQLYHCQYSTKCFICSANIDCTTQDAHYSQAHGDITFRAGAVCSVSPDLVLKHFIMDCDFGRTVCAYMMEGSEFIMNVLTALQSDQLYKYKCTVEVSNPDTGHTLTRTPSVWFNWTQDWLVRLTPAHGLFGHKMGFNLNVKVNITKMADPTELIH